MAELAAPTTRPGAPPADDRSRASRWVSLYGPLLLALYFVATARWGSFLLPGPPYIGDLALGGLILHRLWTLWRSGLPQPLLARWTAIPAALLVVLSAIELAAGPYSVDALRDAAPYLYAVLVLLGQSYREIPGQVAERLVFGALAFLTAWYGLVDAAPSIGEAVKTLGGDDAFFLQPRGDVDGALVGAAAALAIDRIVIGRAPLPYAALASAALVIVLANQSRSALLATTLVFAMLALRHAVLWRRGGRPDPAPTRIGPLSSSGLAVSVLVVVPIAFFALAGTPKALERSVNVVSTPQDDAGIEREDPAGSGGGGDRAFYGSNSGVGTFNARKEAWQRLIDWLHEDGASRAAFGVGFGPHYLQQSDADVLLLGEFADPEVRAAHNFALNTWSRLGGVGLVLLTLLGVPALIAALRLSWRSWDPPVLDLLAAVLVIAIPTTAVLGVVLEGPFGAIPFFWAIGYLGARMIEEGHWRGLPLPARLRRSAASASR